MSDPEFPALAASLLGAKLIFVIVWALAKKKLKFREIFNRKTISEIVNLRGGAFSVVLSEKLNRGVSFSDYCNSFPSWSISTFFTNLISVS
ncbi:hypothetical protein [Candidatus Mycoplasma haematominutum]|uniref:Uncharacterized protein n=1 Tax=Candidatus Mycoplasma haematominutum 'Birmingham 1' TaxID=1116213 RepID=G8C2N3_9MOLU|nr:hypothetical protein [Candidatus Mycoplasma haematominutum]CCE66581.1 hypothetical protein MHM_00630 [Candidatus Mycoplasma haematominutum 'Birmingham 1']